jgi:PTS system N-acetylglucosamine-specific IIC component
LIAALGGAANLRAVDACTTRLRLELADPEAIDEARLKRAGAEAWCAPAAAPSRSCSGRSPTRSPARCARRWPRRLRRPGLRQRPCSRRSAGPPIVEAVEPRSSRLCIRIANGEALDEDRLRGLGFRGFARASPTSVHLITGPDAAAWGSRLEALLAAA